ncbi:Dixin [Ancistrocladus abbreviatus]
MAENEESDVAAKMARCSGGGGIVEVNPKPRKGISSKAIDLLEKMNVKLMSDSSQPHHYLSGNFAPVSGETPPSKGLPVKESRVLSSDYWSWNSYKSKQIEAISFRE